MTDTPHATPYELKQEHGLCELIIRESISKFRWAEVESIGHETLECGSRHQPPRYLIDLSALDYMGSSLVALIVRIWKSANEHDGSLVVVCANDVCLDVLKTAGLDKVWTIVPDRDQALRHLNVTKRSASSPSEPGSRSGSALSYVSIAAVVLALLGLVLLPATPVPPIVAMSLLFGGAIVAFGCGLALLMQNRARTIGLITVLCGAAIGAGGLILL